MVSIFDDEDVRDFLQRTDFKLVRTAGGILQSNALGHLDGEDQHLALMVRKQSGTCANCQETMQELASTTASNHHHESQLSRFNVSIVAVHSQIVPQRRITSSIHEPKALAGQIAVTGGGHTGNQLQPLEITQSGAGRSLEPEPLVKRAKRHVDGVPYLELLWKFEKRDWQEDIATIGEMYQRHVDGLSQWIALPYMRSWLSLKTYTCLAGLAGTEDFLELC